MKRILIILLCLLPMTAWTAGPMQGIVGGGGTTACTYPDKDTDAGTGTDYTWCSAGTLTGVAYRFTAGATYAPRRISVRLRLKTADPGGDITAYIYNDNAGAVGSAIITSSSISASTLTTSYMSYNFDIASGGATLESGTNYWVAIISTSSNCTFANRLYIDTASGAFADKFATWLSPNWTGDNSIVGNYSVSSCN